MLTFYGMTDIGRRHNLNEDAILAEDGTFICDSMGDHKAGEGLARYAV